MERPSDSDVEFVAGLRARIRELVDKSGPWKHPVFLDRCRGRALTLLALDRCGLARRWYERLPGLGDRWLRRRVVTAMAGQPRGRTVGT